MAWFSHCCKCVWSGPWWIVTLRGHHIIWWDRMNMLVSPSFSDKATSANPVTSSNPYYCSKTLSANTINIWIQGLSPSPGFEGSLTLTADLEGGFRTEEHTGVGRLVLDSCLLITVRTVTSPHLGSSLPFSAFFEPGLKCSVFIMETSWLEDSLTVLIIYVCMYV